MEGFILRFVSIHPCSHGASLRQTNSSPSPSFLIPPATPPRACIQPTLLQALASFREGCRNGRNLLKVLQSESIGFSLDWANLALNRKKNQPRTKPCIRGGARFYQRA